LSYDIYTKWVIEEELQNKIIEKIQHIIFFHNMLRLDNHQSSSLLINVEINLCALETDFASDLLFVGTKILSVVLMTGCLTIK